MKCIVNSQGKLNFEIEANTQKEMWEKLASLNEVFGKRVCKRCGTPDAEFHVRVVKSRSGKKEYTYHELRCKGVDKDGKRCGAVKAFSVNNDETGNMYPKTKVNQDDVLYPHFVKNEGDEYAYLPYDGWLKYDKKTDKKY